MELSAPNLVSLSCIVFSPDVNPRSPKATSDRIEDESAEALDDIERCLKSTKSKDESMDERKVVRVDDFFLLVTMSSVFWLVTRFEE